MSRETANPTESKDLDQSAYPRSLVSLRWVVHIAKSASWGQRILRSHCVNAYAGPRAK